MENGFIQLKSRDDCDLLLEEAKYVDSKKLTISDFDNLIIFENVTEDEFEDLKSLSESFSGDIFESHKYDPMTEKTNSEKTNSPTENFLLTGLSNYGIRETLSIHPKSQDGPRNLEEGKTLLALRLGEEVKNCLFFSHAEGISISIDSRDENVISIT